MSYIDIEYPADKIAFYKLLEEQLQLYTAAAPNPVAALANAAAVLRAAFSDINWAGFYLSSGERLVLGPFQGKPAVMEIGFGLGVCGTAWREKKTQVVSDVHCFTGHIACDCSSRAELVVPIFSQDHDVLGVIDMDSAQPGRFDEADAERLARAAELLAPFLSAMQ
jgi:L-methionine (R)-S-oxide reductase